MFALHRFPLGSLHVACFVDHDGFDRFRCGRQLGAAQAIECLTGFCSFRTDSCCLGARVIQMRLHHRDGRFSRLMRPVLV